ncbi:MerR family DNA-binding transcriptional regulator [Microbispora sp. H10670]|uniref:MerR family DNA-binding transcriptional regulator n=1 Tax=Microbispora sp. H10670 TaxID=2729108 RepID=UPI0016049E4E
MTSFTIQDVSRHSGLSEPTLRYYEEAGLVGPIGRDESSGHRRYQDARCVPRRVRRPARRSCARRCVAAVPTTPAWRSSPRS